MPFRRNDMREIQLAGTAEELGRANGEYVAEHRLTLGLAIE